MAKGATTRFMILNKSFNLIYKHGYQATSIDTILATTKVTKGAFFYHFKNKDDMGLAMINEVVYPGMYDILVLPLVSGEAKHIDRIHNMMRNALLKVPFIRAKYGCPAINLLEEMSELNAEFRKSLMILVDEWQTAIKQCLDAAKDAGTISKDVNTAQAAFYIIHGYAGVRAMGKALGTACYAGYLQELRNYLTKL